MSILKFAAAVTLAAFTQTAALHGEKRCPGNVPSVPLRLVQGTLIIAPVSINGTRPYDFLVDSGAQITTVDPQLAAQLGLRSEGTAGVSGVASFGRRSFTRLAQMEMGGRAVADVPAVLDDLDVLHGADQKIRGIVGEDFLTHFDLLIDNEHRMLCLDDTGVMAAAIKGAHVPLVQPHGADQEGQFTLPLVTTAPIAGMRKALLLVLDSGTNVAAFFAVDALFPKTVPGNARTLGRDVNGIQQRFAVLPPQDVVIGEQRIRQVLFVRPLNNVGNVRDPQSDGLLPTELFRRVFVSYRNQFAILDPR